MKKIKIDVSIDELKLAWERLKLDRPGRCFVDHPFIVKWIDLDLDGWLKDLKRKLAEGYVPFSCKPCQVPKAFSLVRPGAVLNVSDEVVYNFLLGRLFPKIHSSLFGFQGDPDIAYQLQDSHEKKEWLRTGFQVWKQWREKSLERLKGGALFVVITDITGFYDNIDIPRIISDLKAITNSEKELQLLKECLTRWSHPRGKGIPQGFSASDILAKLYLHPVDQALRNEGFIHLRYVDDFRIFLNSERECKMAIARLSKLMHDRGLNLQSAKTKILTKEDAEKRIDGVNWKIEGIKENLVREIKEALGLDEDYFSQLEVNAFLEELDGPAPEVLKRTFQDCFLKKGDESFDKTLFHYLLSNMGKARLPVAIGYCLRLMKSRPEETEYCLRYLTSLGPDDRVLEEIVNYMKSSDAIYDFQLYQFVRWFYKRGRKNNSLLGLCRSWIKDRNRTTWLRSYSFAYLGKFGDKSDLEVLESVYSGLSDEIEKSDCAFALRGMEKSRRNAFYSRIEREGGLVAYSVRAAKSNIRFFSSVSGDP